MSVDLYQIPTAAFLEHFVIETALEQRCSLQEASKDVCNDYGIKETLIFPLNETRILGLLYCLLVFPSEIWKRDELLDVVLEGMREDAELLASNAENADPNVVRGIRNAAAHARISFGNRSITFEDRRGDAPPHFKLRLSYHEAANLLLVLGRSFHNSAKIKAFVEETGR